jgi:hypothetical protein
VCVCVCGGGGDVKYKFRLHIPVFEILQIFLNNVCCVVSSGNTIMNLEGCERHECGLLYGIVVGVALRS